MSKFKVGDRVRRIVCANTYGTTGTVLPVGAVCTVTGFDSMGWPVVKFNGEILFGNDPERFELVRELQKIVVTTDGKTTTARLFSGNDLVKSAVAKCSPRDEFVFETGVALATDRLLDREEKAEPEAPKFPKEQLQPGIFGRLNTGCWFVVVGDKLVYTSSGERLGGFDYLSNVRADGSIGCFGRHIDCVVQALSYANARDNARVGHFIWSRPGAKFE